MLRNYPAVESAELRAEVYQTSDLFCPAISATECPRAADGSRNGRERIVKYTAPAVALVREYCGSGKIQHPSRNQPRLQVHIYKNMIIFAP